jgi:hypothetical protein
MDFEAGREVDLILETDPDTLGHEKSDDKAFWREHQADDDFKITASCVHSVHGYLNGPNSDPASLLVLRFKLDNWASDKMQRRFKYFRLILKFRKELASAQSLPSEDPFIITYEPAGHGERFLTESVAKVTRTNAIQGTFQAQGPPLIPLGGSASATQSTSTETEQKSRYTISSDVGRDQSRGERRGPDSVTWASAENKFDKLGLGDTFQVAVLLQRPGADRFHILFDFKTIVDTRYRMAEWWGEWFGRQTRNWMPQGFDPSYKDDEIPAGVEPLFLGRLKQNNALEKLGLGYASTGKGMESCNE